MPVRCCAEQRPRSTGEEARCAPPPLIAASLLWAELLWRVFWPRAEIGANGRVTALAPICRLQPSEIVATLKQQAKPECRVGIAALIGTTIGSHRTLNIPLLFQQHPKIRSRRSIPPLISTTKRSNRTRHITVLRQQRTKPERTLGIAALIGTPIRSHRSDDVPLLLQQRARPQIRGRRHGAVARLVDFRSSRGHRTGGQVPGRCGVNAVVQCLLMPA
jgi:hypothetical protein